jgi:hypothetical protein
VASLLAAMPNVGSDADFARQPADDANLDVFD